MVCLPDEDTPFSLACLQPIHTPLGYPSLVKMLSMLYNVFSIYIHLKYRGKKHIADFLVTGKQEQSAGYGCVKDPPGHCSAWVDCMAASIKYHKA
jgi:hypothetical protein